MPRLPADAFFAFYICYSCFTDYVLQSRHAVASRAPEFQARAPAQRTVLSTVAAASRARKPNFALDPLQSQPQRLYFGIAKKSLSSRALSPQPRRLGAAAALFEWLMYRLEIYCKEENSVIKCCCRRRCWLSQRCPMHQVPLGCRTTHRSVPGLGCCTALCPVLPSIF